MRENVICENLNSELSRDFLLSEMKVQSQNFSPGHLLEAGLPVST